MFGKYCHSIQLKSHVDVSIFAGSHRDGGLPRSVPCTSLIDEMAETRAVQSRLAAGANRDLTPVPTCVRGRIAG